MDKEKLLKDIEEYIIESKAKLFETKTGEELGKMIKEEDKFMVEIDTKISEARNDIRNLLLDYERNVSNVLSDKLLEVVKSLNNTFILSLDEINCEKVMTGRRMKRSNAYKFKIKGVQSNKFSLKDTTPLFIDAVLDLTTGNLISMTVSNTEFGQASAFDLFSLEDLNIINNEMIDFIEKTDIHETVLAVGELENL